MRLANGGRGEHPRKLASDGADDGLAFVKRGQRHTGGLGSQGVEMSLTIANLDLVVLGNEGDNNRLHHANGTAVRQCIPSLGLERSG